MNAFLESISGHKTYIAVAIGILVVLANAFLGVPIPGVSLDKTTWMQDLWTLILIATGRSAVAKIA